METDTRHYLQQQYEEACRAQAEAQTALDYAKAQTKFLALQDFEDSPQRAAQCLQEAQALNLEAAYSHACHLQQQERYLQAAAEFDALESYRDSRERAQACRDEKEAQRIRSDTKWVHRIKQRRLRAARRIILSLAAAAAVFLVYILYTVLVVQPRHYARAEAYLAQGQQEYAAMEFGRAGGCRDAHARCYELWGQIVQRNTVDVKFQDFTAILENGTVFTTVSNHMYNNQEVDTSDWEDIVDVSSGYSHTVGLRSDGRVVATGYNKDKRCNVSFWRNIVDISAGRFHTVALRTDGTVVATGDNDFHQCDVSEWEDIIAVAAGDSHSVGLKADGTVVSTGYIVSDPLSSWSNIVAIDAFGDFTVGYRADGSVVTYPDYMLSEAGWTDLTQLVYFDLHGYTHMVGLHSDGTVSYASSSEEYLYDTSRWTDIVSVSVAGSHVVGLKEDGTVVAVGNNSYGACNVSYWTDIVSAYAVSTLTIGIRSDGTLVFKGQTWEDIPDNLQVLLPQ